MSEMSNIKQAEIVEIYPFKVWIESDMMGDYHVMVHHEGHGVPFCYLSLHYDYAYTSNSTIRTVAISLLKLIFNIDEKDIVWKSRPFWKAI